MAGMFGDVTPVQNTLLDAAQPYLHALQVQSGQEALRGAQMQNDYTAAVQPAQVNMLLQGINGLTDLGASNAAPATPNTLSAAPGSATVGQGSTPVSGGFSLADAVHQNESRGSMRPGIMGDGGQAAGPMQVHPEALADVNTRLGTNYTHAQLAAQPDIGKQVGTEYLHMMQEKFGRPDYALGAYNAGPGAMQAAIASGKGIAGLSPGAQAYVAHGMSAMHAAGHSDTVAAMMNGAPAPSAGVQVASNDPSSGVLPAAQASASAPASQQPNSAQSEVRRIALMRQMALAEPKGAGMRAAAAFQQALDQIPKVGAVTDGQGNVVAVPGGYGAISAASNATAAGKVAPEAQLHAMNEGVTQLGAQQTHAANAAVDLNMDRAKPMTVGPGQTLTTPGTAGVGAPATAASLQLGAPATMPQPGQGGTYQAPVNPATVQTADYERDSKEIGGIADAGQAARSSQINLQTMRDLVGQITPGATSQQLIQAAAQYLPKDVAASFASRAANMTNPEAAQEFSKLALMGAGSAERGVLGARGGYQAIRLFQSANPSDALLPNTNQAILAKQLIGAQADADYSKGAQDHFSTNAAPFRTGQGPYAQTLAEYDRQWQGQRNPQVYAGAIGALAGLSAADGQVNGKPVKGWATGLSADEYRRALEVVSRAAPNDTVEGKTGRISMQPRSTQAGSASAPVVPAVGTVQQGHRFLGGNPASPSSWQAVQ